MHDEEVIASLTYLAVTRNVAHSTQNQALNALVFFYRHVLDRPLGDITTATRTRKPEKLPVVLNRQEVVRILLHLEGNHRLIDALLSKTFTRRSRMTLSPRLKTDPNVLLS